MRTLPQDITYALRGLIRRPAAHQHRRRDDRAGVGANTAIFSVVNGILLRPLPYRDAERIVSFGHEAPQWLTSDPDFLDYQREVPSLEALAAYTQGLATLSSGGDPDRIRAVRVSDDFFRVLGVSPLLGRAFAPDEFHGNQPTSVVLSYGLWKRRFGGDEAIVNGTVVMNGVQHVVVGVMPPFFNYPEARSDIWVPMPRFNPDSLGDRANHYLFMVGKFKSGTTVERLRSDAKLVAARIMADNPGSFDRNNHCGHTLRSSANSWCGARGPILPRSLARWDSCFSSPARTWRTCYSPGPKNAGGRWRSGVRSVHRAHAW